MLAVLVAELDGTERQPHKCADVHGRDSRRLHCGHAPCRRRNGARPLPLRDALPLWLPAVSMSSRGTSSARAERFSERRKVACDPLTCRTLLQPVHTRISQRDSGENAIRMTRVKSVDASPHHRRNGKMPSRQSKRGGLWSAEVMREELPRSGHYQAQLAAQDPQQKSS
jgi:hypothetical protein